MRDEYEDEDDDDFSEVVPCPECGKEVHEDAEWCPACESYITPGSGESRAKPLWFAVAFFLALGMALMWAFWISPLSILGIPE